MRRQPLFLAGIVAAAIIAACSQDPTTAALLSSRKAHDVVSCTGDVVIRTHPADSVKFHVAPNTDFSADFYVVNDGDSACVTYAYQRGTDSVTTVGDADPDSFNLIGHDSVLVTGSFHSLSKRTGKASIETPFAATSIDSLPIVIMSGCDAGTVLTLEYFTGPGVELDLPPSTEFGGLEGGFWFVINTGTQACTTTLTQSGIDSVAGSAIHTSPSPSTVTVDPGDTVGVFGYWRTLSSGSGWAKMSASFGGYYGIQLVSIVP